MSYHAAAWMGCSFFVRPSSYGHISASSYGHTSTFLSHLVQNRRRGLIEDYDLRSTIRGTIRSRTIMTVPSGTISRDNTASSILSHSVQCCHSSRCPRFVPTTPAWRHYNEPTNSSSSSPSSCENTQRRQQHNATTYHEARDVAK